MNYPIESLAIVAPVIFVILVVAFPLIGVLAGWKRAAYWGGGNFIFYILGLIIWVLAGNAIAAAIKPLLANLFSSLTGGKEVSDQVVVSLLAPVWFILFMAVSELILLINYYAWYKKVVGLKKIQVKTKNGMVKQYAKVDKKANTVGYKVGNKLGGAALLGILTLPTTMAFTQVIYNGTTSPKTRANNAFSSGLYNGLLKISTGPFSWLAYSSQSCYDFDAIYSSLTLLNLTIEGKSIMECIEDTVATDIQTIMDGLQQETGSDIKISAAVNDLADFWNDLAAEHPEEISGVFSSSNALELVKQMMPENFEPQIEVGSENVEVLVDEMWELIDGYEHGKIGDTPIEKLQQVNITEESFNSFTNFFVDMLEFDSEITSDDKEKVVNCMKDIISLVFIYPGMPDHYFTPDQTI